VLIQLLLGAALVVVSAVLHIVVLDLINHKVRSVAALHAVPLRARIRLPLLIFATLSTFLSHVAQIWLWAAFYLGLGEFDRLEPALYFSTVVFTTLGFGDIVVSADWRLMASCEAAAGLLLFGLSTAFLFEVLLEILRRRRD
jgi:predicted small integral membrane protein